MRSPFFPCFGLLLCLVMGSASFAQQTDSVAGTPLRDSTLVQRLQHAVQKESGNYRLRYSGDKAGVLLARTMQELRYTGERAKLYLRNAPDTVWYRNQLNKTLAEMQVLQDGIFYNQGSNQTARNLAVTSSILSELLVKLNGQRSTLGKHVQSLTDLISRIDSLSADSSLYAFPPDSLSIMQYLRKLTVVSKELGPADSILRASIGPATQLQTDYDLIAFDVRSRYDEVEKLSRALANDQFNKEFAYLWEDPGVRWTFSDVIRLSVAKAALALKYYLKDYTTRLLIFLLLIGLSWYFLRALKRKWEDEKELFSASSHGELVLRFPLLSAIVIVISVFQFIFLKPPFSFNFLLWLIGAICLAVIFYQHISRFWMGFWIVMVLYFLLAGAGNILLRASRPERWVMLFLSLSGTIYGISLLRTGRKQELKERNILFFIGFVVFMEAAATLCNLFGRFNLAKNLFVTGFTGIVIAITFLWTVRLLNEGLGIIAAVYKHPDRKFFYIDFQKVGDKVPTFFYVFLVAGWFILVGRQFYAFQQAATPFTEFLNAERTVGSYTFTINNLFVFLSIIAIATIVSQVFSFFAAEPGDQRKKDTQARKPGVGSWLLLIRIFILTLGLWLAFAAAGIPMDKLAIVIGALGVGIGFGLQGLVSNLVSGLIIAFEKPVNVGDIIEVNGKLGTMKSIGFRSSVVSLTEGACLVVPNSDLLSNHVVNWTMGHNRRRLNLIVSVAYGTNLKTAKSILEETLAANERLLKYPEPIVSVKEFGDSGISFDLYFWTGNIREFLLLRNEVMTAVNEAFEKAGIVIPFPQHDVHVINPKEQDGR